MGWCGATPIFDRVCDKLLVNGKIDKQAILEELIDVLKDMDWDCVDESQYFDHPLVKKAFYALGYDYHDDYTDISDVCVVMTGFRDAELQRKIESAGGRVISAVSSKTTHLLIAGRSAQEGSTKMDKARQLGVKIMSPAEFKRNFYL